jgi:hypothetical protein
MVGLIMSKIFPLVMHQQMCTVCRALEIQVDLWQKNMTDVSGIIILKIIYYAE